MKENIIAGLILFVMTVAGARDTPAEEVVFCDSLGRTVTVQAPVRRAVVVIDYEIVPALGVWDQIVAVTRWAKQNDLIRAVRPNIESEFPSIGTGSDINIEALMALKPDFVHTWTVNPQNVAFIAAKGIPTIAANYQNRQDLYGGMRLLGRIFGQSLRAETVIARMDRIFDLIRKNIAPVPRNMRQKALWLYGKPTLVAGSDNLNNDLFSLIGAINPAAEIRQQNPEVSIEQIIRWNPDILFIWGSSRYGPQNILGNPQWQSVAAVRTRRVYKMPVWSTWSPRLAPEALWMAARLYPDAFREVDVIQEIDTFYHDVYGISYKQVSSFEN